MGALIGIIGMNIVGFALIYLSWCFFSWRWLPISAFGKWSLAHKLGFAIAAAEFTILGIVMGASLWT